MYFTFYIFRHGFLFLFYDYIIFLEIFQVIICYKCCHVFRWTISMLRLHNISGNTSCDHLRCFIQRDNKKNKKKQTNMTVNQLYHCKRKMLNRPPITLPTKHYTETKFEQCTPQYNQGTTVGYVVAVPLVTLVVISNTRPSDRHERGKVQIQRR